jgi:biotin carboxyl carrier protein
MFIATVNNQHKLEIESNQVNGEAVRFDCEKLPDGSYHILLNDKSLNAKLIDFDSNDKTVQLLINNQKFDVQLKDDFDLLLSKMGMDAKASNVISDIKSPMPGLVLDINVNIGDSVETGQALMVLEAMKMENVIAAPNPGIVKSVEVAKQDKVDKNQILIRFE